MCWSSLRNCASWNIRFHRWPELAWIVAVSAAVAVLTVLVEFDVAAIENWRTWALALLSGAVRAAAGAAAAVLTRPVG